MDEFDRASELEQIARDAAIQNASMQTRIKPCGKCLNCGEELESDLRWCDADCRTDFERRNEEPAKLHW